MKVNELFDLSGQVALITGGGQGIGLQIADIYAEMGCKLALCSRSLQTCQESALKLSEKYGVEAKAYQLDVTNEDNADQIVEQILQDFGQIDILVNNSGTNWRGNVEDTPLEEWKRVQDVNVTGIFIMSKKVGESMRKRKKGKIINISSTAGIKVRDPEFMNAISYTTSKGAVVHFTKDLAMKWAQHGIHVNSIAPGVFPTEMTMESKIKGNEEKLYSTIPLRKFGNEHDLKGVALLLATKASDYITGEIIAVNGGSGV